MSPFEQEIVSLLEKNPMTIGELYKRLAPAKNVRRVGQVVRDLAERKILVMKSSGSYTTVDQSIELPKEETPKRESIKDLPLKLKVLSRLRELMAPDIAAVLGDIRDDLVRK